MADRPRFLFVAPHPLSTGERITASRAASELRVRGAATHLLAAPAIGGLVPGAFDSRHELAREIGTNQQRFAELSERVRPNVVVFADFSLLEPDAGGLPLSSPAWIEELDRLPTNLATFDHLGLEHTSATHPGRMIRLDPCPLHDPEGSRNGGVRFATHRQILVTDEQKDRLRRSVSASDAYLVFHSASPWMRAIAKLLGWPLYAHLTDIIGWYAAGLAKPLVILSVNGGDLPQSSERNVSVVNVAGLDPAAYDALLGSADLVMTENSFSASLGKAVCADVPALSWVNHYDVHALRDSGCNDSPIGRLLEASPDWIKPWISFPIWPPAIESKLDVFHDNPISHCIIRAELFGGLPSAEMFCALLSDAELRRKISAAQHAYTSSLSNLPDAADVLWRIK